MTFETYVERELSHLLTSIDEECLKLESRVHDAEEDWHAKLKERENVKYTLELYRQRHRLTAPRPAIDEQLRQKLAGKTVKEMIIELASENDPPAFRVVDINKRLVQAGMFIDSQKAAEGVYSTLGRNRRSFLKLGKGRYLVNPEAAGLTSGKQGNQKAMGATGLRERVEAVLREHPTWTREQTAAELQRQGWDFRGKNPTWAVGACYARLKVRQPEASQPLRSVS